MAHSPHFHDKGTRFTNYSSIHSADAFVGDYQVMYTPGSTSPQQARANRKSTRFSRAASSTKPQQNVSQSYLLPSNMPNTSQIMPDHGPLPNIQVHYNIPSDEKQIVASLRALQRDLAEAMETIATLTQERDEAIKELNQLRSNARKAGATTVRNNSIEDELFDLSSPIQDPSRRSSDRLPHSKKGTREDKETQISDEARVISRRVLRENDVRDRQPSNKPEKHYKQPALEDTEQSLPDENPTAASNTSRRRRRQSLDDNMTSAYILPDITMEHAAEPASKVSKAARNVLHSLDPEHINSCDVCYRLTKHIRATEKQRRHSNKENKKPATISATNGVAKVQDFASIDGNAARMQQPDYTAAIAGFKADDSVLHDHTMRPKIAPEQALVRVRTLMDAQFRKAKERHGLAWAKYSMIEAPLSSKKHAEISKELQHWAEKMEECRVHLDYLRDVEEGMVMLNE